MLAVYPRVGGEPGMYLYAAVVVQGLSPRGRGTQSGLFLAFAGAGSIPAWAGNPRLALILPGRNRVYPRVGGEPRFTPGLFIGPVGLSPRGRGTLRRGKPERHPSRSIPAWAGNPGSPRLPQLQARVYPRVGGEPKTRSRGRFQDYGLSPRGRGTLGYAGLGRVAVRSIPAWAGNPAG